MSDPSSSTATSEGLDLRLLSAVVLLVTLFFLSLSIMGLFSRKNHFPVEGRTVVITGGSQGMGRGLAKLLASKGANVVIVARDIKKLDAALEYIKSAAKSPSTQRFLSLSANLTSPEENQRVIAEVTAWNDNTAPDIVWANAGSSKPNLFLETPINTLREQMDANYWTTAYLAHSTLSAWLEPRSEKLENTKSSPPPNHFIMTSSTLAFCGIAGYSPYGPPKAALRNLADSLRSELNLYAGARRSPSATPETAPPVDVKVHLVAPGTILSPGLEEENKMKHPVSLMLEEGDPKQTEDEVAAVAVQALERGHYLISTQSLGTLMRASALHGSPRNNWFIDTVLSWVTSIAWLFIGPDMEAKVFKYGKQHGLAAQKPSTDG